MLAVLRTYLALGLYMVWVIFFTSIALAMAWLIRPRRPTPAKLATYESGLVTSGQTWVRFRISYYLYALAFVIFDIESIFLYPWAAAFRSLGIIGLIETGIFVFVLLLGLGYAWREGALEWK